jgi:type VI secretion system protein ImpF
MADVDYALLPSILDRLLDDEPEVSTEPVNIRGRGLRELKASVRRDLENLLNARCNFVKIPEGLPEAANSILNFGLPDFSTYILSAASGQQNLCRIVERQIRLFEPRLAQVQVTLIPSTNIYERIVRFRVDAELKTRPAPEPVSFDTTMQVQSGDFSVRGEA